MTDYRFSRPQRSCYPVATRSSYRWKLICAWLIVVVAGCGVPEKSVDREKEVPDLSGNWETTLRSAGIDGASIQGTISLLPDPVDAAKCEPAEQIICATHMRGTHELDLARLLGYALPANVDAAVIPEGGLLLQVGGCCDRGEIEAHVQIDPESMRGTWRETRVGGGRKGTVVLRRIR